MKRALEALLVAAVVLAGAALAYQLRARAAARAAAANPAAQAGTDAEPGTTPRRLAPDERGVTALPTIKLSSPPRTMRRTSAAPPPPSR